MTPENKMDAFKNLWEAIELVSNSNKQIAATIEAQAKENLTMSERLTDLNRRFLDHLRIHSNDIKT